MKQIFLIISIFLFWGIVTIANPAIADDDVKIGSELNPKVLSKFPMPKELSGAGSMAINGDYLWTTGSEMVIDSNGKRSWKTRIAVFDISNSSKPKLLVIHDAPDYARNTGFFNQYAYMMYNRWVDQKLTEEQKKLPRVGLLILDVSNPMNPTVVKKNEEMFFHFPKMYIDEQTKTMYIFDGSSSGLVESGQIDQTKIYKINLEDPKNSKIIPCKIIGANGKEISFINDYVNDIWKRDNFLYVLTRSKMLVLYTSPKDLRLIDEHERSIASFEAGCMAEEYISRDDNYLFVAGEAAELYYPGENPKPGKFINQNGIVLLIHSTGLFPFYSSLGQASTGVKIPFSPRYMHSKGTLVYIIGYEKGDDYPRTYVSTNKFLVVDFTKIADPIFAGSMDFDGSITDWIIKDSGTQTIAYLMVFKQEGLGIDAKTKSTLYTLELPVKEGAFQHQYMSMEEMYPGYKEPEIKPNPLEATLRDIIDKPSGQLTIADYKDIKALNLEQKKLTDLNGIELCTDLEELKSGVNHISDIIQLSGLKKLRVLDLRFNKIDNIEPLKNLSNLEELNLYENKIVDISPLLSLPKLKKLNLSRNEITDLTLVSQLTGLTNLKLEYCNIFKSPSLAGLNNLKALDLMSNDIFYMDFIADLPEGLEELNLQRNNIKNINNLNLLPGLKKLVLEGNNLKDISPIKNLKNLEELNLSDNKKIEDFSPLERLINLKKLDLSELYIDNIAFLSGLTNLEDLDICHFNVTLKKISDLKPLENLKNLKNLNANENEIDNIKPLADLTELVTLNLKQNKIQNADALINLKKLERLDLSENKIMDISSLSNLEKLKDIVLFKNEIKDVTPLLESKIPPDCTITIGGNQIPAEQLKELRRKFIILPNENEGMALTNMIVFASTEINFHEAEGRYTNDIKELVTSGFLMHQGDVEKLTLDSIISKYDVDLFNIDDKGFTIVIAPEKDIEGRTFAITEEGVVLEWLGDEKPDLTKINFDDSSLWKKWPKESQFSVYSCGTGG